MHPFPDAYCELNAALNTRGGKREWSTVPAPERSWSGKGNRQGSRQPQYRGISVEEPQKYKSGRNPELAIKKTSWKIDIAFIQPWPCTAHWAECFSDIIIFTLPINSRKNIPLLSPFPRWGSRSLARLSSFPKVTPPAQNKVEIWSRDLLSEPLLLTPAPKA